jgi:hypothetical protein
VHSAAGFHPCLSDPEKCTKPEHWISEQQDYVELADLNMLLGRLGSNLHTLKTPDKGPFGMGGK